MKESHYFVYNFLGVALLALLCCPDRNDYNLPLGVLAFLLWNYQYQRSQRHRILWLLLVSLIFDLVWILSIGVSQWGGFHIHNQLQGLTIVISSINMCYKLVLVIYSVIAKEDTRDLFTWDAIQHQVLQSK